MVILAVFVFFLDFSSSYLFVIVDYVSAIRAFDLVHNKTPFFGKENAIVLDFFKKCATISIGEGGFALKEVFMRIQFLGTAAAEGFPAAVAAPRLVRSSQEEST